MKTLRKTLLGLESPCVKSLMALIPTQSKETICTWCFDYAESVLLPIFEERFSDDARPAAALDAARRWLKGEIKLPEARKAILACHTAARVADEANKNPVSMQTAAAVAAARAIGQAAGTIHAPGHSLALAFYGSAAVVYHKFGPDADAGRFMPSAEDCDREAAAECRRMEARLEGIAVANEANPAKINWEC
jgi:hypothetical protein